MGGLFLLGLALFGLYKLGGDNLGTGLKKLANIPLPSPWPEQAGSALRQGGHYFFVIPVTQAPDAKQLAAALGLLGWSELSLFPPKASLDVAPIPRPADWQNSTGTVRVAGRWAGVGGTALDLSSLAPLGLDTSGAGGKVRLWMSTEDYIGRHARAF
jgi:hypothetical protein